MTYKMQINVLRPCTYCKHDYPILQAVVIRAKSCNKINFMILTHTRMTRELEQKTNNRLKAEKDLKYLLMI